MRVSLALLLVALCASFTGCSNDWVKQQVDEYRSQGQEPDAQTIAAGLKQALELGSERAAATLGKVDGYLKNPPVHIPAPDQLQRAESLLRKLGAGKYADQFVTSLNRAAEAAAPKAKPIFVDVIRQMTIQDAVGVLKGGDDAATQYFRRHSQDRLIAIFRPVVARTTSDVGVTAYYKRFVQKAATTGLVDTRELDLDDYVTHKALDGLFYMLAQEERRIRQDPIARTTELLREVFGS
jgi:Protein of unknown function (DUF4197)